MEAKLETVPQLVGILELERRLERVGARLVEEALGRPAAGDGQPVWISPAAFVREMQQHLGRN